MTSDRDFFGPNGLEPFFDRLASIDAASWNTSRSELQSTARAWQLAWSEAKQTGLGGGTREFRATKRDYDEWITNIFHATEPAIPIEGLLRDFADQFAKVHQIGTHGNSTAVHGAKLMVLTGYPPQGASDWQFRGLTQAGLSDVQWLRMKERLAQAAMNPLLQGIFSGRIAAEDLELVYLPYVRDLEEHGLFDELLGYRPHTKPSAKFSKDAALGAALMGPNFWLRAQPLRHADGRYAHVVLVLYPNKGHLFDLSKLPDGAASDQRALDILAAVYNELSGHLRTLVDDVQIDKRAILDQLGAQLLNHEVGGGVRQIRASSAEALLVVEWIERDFEADALPEEFTALATHVRTLGSFAEQLVITTDAFNQLDRRGVVQALSVRALFSRAAAMLKVRCGSLHVRLETHIQPESLEITNDSTLLLQALLNLGINALNAIEESESFSSSRVLRFTAGVDLTDPRFLRISVANTGPKLAEEIRPVLFRRGTTSRQQGHGQGLYLVRRIAQYCGGDACLSERPPEGFDVAFELTVLQRLESSTQLGFMSNVEHS